MVAVRLLRRSQHRERARSSTETYHARSLPETRSEGEATGDVSLSLLRRYVDESPEPYRTALILRYFEGYEVGEIAQRLSMSKSRVHTHLKRGIQRLRSRVVLPEGSRGGRWSSLVGWLGLSVTWGRRAPSRTARPLAVGGLVLVSLSSWLLWSARGSARPDSPFAPVTAPVANGPVPTPFPALRPLEPLQRDAIPGAAAPVRNGRVAGVVRTPAGDPLPGARVHAGGSDGSEADSTLSDSEGRYEIAPRGDYVWVTHPEWCASPRTYLSTVLEPRRLDLILSPTRGAVRVSVLDAEGRPVAEAEIRQEVGWTNPQVISTRGMLELDPPPPLAVTNAEGQAWTLFLERPTSELLVVAPDRPAWHATLPTPEAGSELRIELPPEARLEGVCRGPDGQPSWNARIEVLQFGGFVSRATKTDASGAFRVTGLARGEFLLLAAEPGPGRASARFAGWLESGDQEAIEVALGEGNSILGRVLDESGPVAGARVELEAFNLHVSEGPRRIVHTNDTGRFEFSACSWRGHTLQVFLPGAGEPCLGEEQLRPGVTERSYRVPRGETSRAPIELRFSGPRPPLSVELRRVAPAWSEPLVSELGEPGLFRSPPLPEGDYRVYAWDVDWAVWRAPDLRHDPLHPEVHAYDTPEPGRLYVRPRLPDGVRPEDVEVALLVPSFHHFGRASSGPDDARRLLPWSEAEQAFVAWAPPGLHGLIVRGPGLSEFQQDVEILSGVDVSVVVAPRGGIETTIFFESLLDPPVPGRSRSRSLLPSEEIDLVVYTPSGRETIVLPARNLRRVEGGFEFVVGLPPDTLELEARTRAPKGSAYVPRVGRCALEPGSLGTTGARPRIRVPLVNDP